mgnify:CR=1 FL=1
MNGSGPAIVMPSFARGIGTGRIRTDFPSAVLDMTDCSRADLTEAICWQTSFVGAMLTDAVLTDAVIWRADLRYSDLTGTALARVDASDPSAAAFIWKADFDGATAQPPAASDETGTADGTPLNPRLS